MDPVKTQFFCPHCNEEINEVKYTSLVNEYGTAYLIKPSVSDALYASDHECNDSETQDTDYFCPQCDEEIRLSTVIVRSQKAAPIKPPNKDDSESHIEIISPKGLQVAESRENAIICINRKCRSLILISIQENMAWNPPAWVTNRPGWYRARNASKDSWKTAPVACPKCGTLNDPGKFFSSLSDSDKKKQTV